MKCGILFLKDFLFTFFKTAGKDVTLRQNETIKRITVMVRERVKINDKKNFLEETRKRKRRELQH